MKNSFTFVMLFSNAQYGPKIILSKKNFELDFFESKKATGHNDFSSKKDLGPKKFKVETNLS